MNEDWEEDGMDQAPEAQELENVSCESVTKCVVLSICFCFLFMVSAFIKASFMRSCFLVFLSSGDANGSIGHSIQ